VLYFVASSATYLTIAIKAKNITTIFLFFKAIVSNLTRAIIYGSPLDVSRESSAAPIRTLSKLNESVPIGN
jgi:hypothetical protein